MSTRIEARVRARANSTQKQFPLVVALLPLFLVFTGGTLLLITERWSLYVIGVVAGLAVLTAGMFLRRTPAYLAVVVSASWVTIAVTSGAVGVRTGEQTFLWFAAVFLVIGLGVLWRQHTARRAID